jgi:hypothetical protein
MTKKYAHNMLFRPGPDFELNAAVGENGGPYSFRDYADGFFEAGNAIFKRVNKKRTNIDISVYPLAYCYRHAVELYLKSLILHSASAINIQGDFKKNHTLIDQWNEFRKLAVRIDPKVFEPTIELEIAQDIIQDIAQIDQSGQTFRYPSSVKGEIHLTEQAVINVKILFEGMTILHEFFWKWSELIAERYEVNAL